MTEKLYKSSGRRGAKWRRIRLEILERDGHTCAYCGGPAGSVDHVLPISTHPHLAVDETNLVACCGRCNRIKAARSPLPASPSQPPVAATTPAMMRGYGPEHQPPVPPRDHNGIPRPCESYGGPEGGHIGFWYGSGRDQSCHSRLWGGDQPKDAWQYNPDYVWR